ncbi:MAG: phosphotransferase family protein [Nitriliruptoraceae bacterium]
MRAPTDDPEPPAGLDLEAITDWLASRTALAPPLRAERATGGRSNLTYIVTDANDRRVVVRRPPLHGVLSSAHDVAREHRILSALGPTDVPVPSCLGVEDDPAIIGAPFYAMEYVGGIIARDQASARRLPPDQRRTSSGSLVDVLARLHAVDIDAVGLGDLARREDYLARQLHRWHTQLEQGRTRDTSALEDVHHRLAAEIPEQGPATIVHGDYRLDNLVLDPSSGEVSAVLDWELTTLGDPLADLGLLLVYWVEAADLSIALPDPPTLVPGFATREQLVARYAAATGRDLSDIGYYVAFGYWKLACILEGVHGRYVSGAYGPDAEGFAELGDLVSVLAERAATAAAEVGR